MPEIMPAKLDHHSWSRRRFLKAAGAWGLSAAGVALLDACGIHPGQSATAGAGKLETTTIRIPWGNPGSICVAPALVAEPLLRAEGFTDIQYIRPATPALAIDSLAAATGDVSLYFSAPDLIYVDGGKPITMLAGVHIGCFELFGSDKINQISDLKGKTLAVSQLGGDKVFMASILANVGLNPNTDVTWLNLPPSQTKQLFIDGQIEAMLAFPPTAQELAARQIGHVVLNSMYDAPWSGYYCCMVTVNQGFMQKNPVATKAALRAILQATDLCAAQPANAAQLLVDRGFAPNYQYALAAMQQIPYNHWRAFNPADTLRFYGLLLGEVGMVKGAPEQLIKTGTDWTFLNQLKTELPATPAPAGFDSARNLLCTIDSRRVAGAGRRGFAE